MTKTIKLIPILLAGLFLLQAQQTPSQKTFPTVDDAVKELIRATEAGDSAALAAIFGPEGSEWAKPNVDKAEDRQSKDEFSRASKEGWRVMEDPSKKDTVTLLLGNAVWPFPVPIVKQNGSWRFDTKAGKEEIAAREIGGHELDAIELCRAYVEAQKEYATADRDGSGLRQYAQHINSSPGKRDGLYWPPTGNADTSPAGKFFADLSVEDGLKSNQGQPKISHGYHFRILRAQGPNAYGGAMDYVEKGYMIAGYGLVAFPADYGVSGVKTFIVNQDGIVYEKDLGPKTTEIGKAMSVFNPDSSWKVAP